MSHAYQLQKELWHVMYKSALREKIGNFYVTGISFTIMNSLTTSASAGAGQHSQQRKHFGHVVAPTGTVSILITACSSHGIKKTFINCKVLIWSLLWWFMQEGRAGDNVVSVPFCRQLTPGSSQICGLVWPEFEGEQKSQRLWFTSSEVLDIREGNFYFQAAERALMCSVFIGLQSIQIHRKPSLISLLVLQLLFL